ncbi:hypothetical protein EGP64_00275 [bacterium]|nr:hypothetical protein [bacterium]
MKKMLISFILGGIVFTLGGVVATTAISSTNVTYQKKTVNTALDELYNQAVTGKELVADAITNKGITTTASDTYETMATNINNIDIDHTEIIGKINNLESKHNSDVTSLTSSISSINQRLNTSIQNATNLLSGGFVQYSKYGKIVICDFSVYYNSPLLQNNEYSVASGLPLPLSLPQGTTLTYDGVRGYVTIRDGVLFVTPLTGNFNGNTYFNGQLIYLEKS